MFLILYGMYCANTFTIFYWYYKPDTRHQFVQGIPLSGWGLWYFLTFNPLCVAAIYAHQRASHFDPGIIKEGLEEPVNLPNHYEMTVAFCQKCEKEGKKKTWKPPRAHHCRACGYCIFKVKLSLLTLRLDGPPLPMGEQLRGAQEHEALFAVCDLHRHLFSLPVPVDGPLLLPTVHCEEVEASP